MNALIFLDIVVLLLLLPMTGFKIVKSIIHYNKYNIIKMIQLFVYLNSKWLFKV